MALTVLVLVLQTASIFAPDYNLIVVKGILGFFKADYLLSVS